MAPSFFTALAFALSLQGVLSLPGDSNTNARRQAATSGTFLGGKPRAADQNGNWEYIVVGSGAGGGTLAARLALNGRRVLLIDAGDDQGNNLNVTVPTFHAYSTEDPALAWDFYVRHYADDARGKLDTKYAYRTPSGEEYHGLNPPAGSTPLGILYPRSGTLGGCTAHNALVHVYPHEKDWNHIAEITGDNTWTADKMRDIYAEKVERLGYSAPGSPGHGYDGWLGVERADILLGYNDTKLQGLGISAAARMGQFAPGVLLLDSVSTLANLGRILAGDANSGDSGRDAREGVYNIPLAEWKGRRNGAREFVRAVYDSGRFPLDVMINTLVTKVDFAQGTDGTPRATGVSYLSGKSLYRADPRSDRWNPQTGSAAPGTPGSAKATAEVIIAGGAFNSPQILKLSGIGPKEELAKFNIPVVVDAPGVGTNLQDHFEIGVTGQAPDSFAVIENCSYNKKQPDVCLEDWKQRNGPYASSNGFIFAMIKKTTVAVQDTVYGDDPDILVFGGIADFRGYYPGYSNDVYGYNNFTWVVLKAHTGNYGPKAGTVKLRSTDPRDTPDILFNYFDAGRTDNGADSRDLQAMTEALRLSREVNDKATYPLTFSSFLKEIRPGKEYETDAQIKEHIKREAWSHHASCTVPIGASNDSYAVLDSKFRVKGVQGLRVADASVFPRIPGFFIAPATYMIGEKAALAILNNG